MEIIFNEISSFNKPPNEHNAINILENLASTCAIFKKNGFEKLRVTTDFWNENYFSDIDINSFLSKLPDRTTQSFLRSFIRKPFIAEGFSSVADEKYAENNYYFNGSPVTGLAYAYLLNTLTISLTTDDVWNNTELVIIEEINTLKEEKIVKNASKPKHYDAHKEWIEGQKPVELLKTNKKSIEKPIKLRDDHGKDTLQDLSERIIKSEYVEKVINSLPFSPKEKKFIKKIYPNGQIEIVLVDTDKGLGIIIQTTGRNYNETKEIGKILERKYK